MTRRVTGAAAPPLTGGISASSSPAASACVGVGVLAVDGHRGPAAARAARRGRARAPSAASASATVAPSAQLELDRVAPGALAQDREQAHLDAHRAPMPTPGSSSISTALARRRRRRAPAGHDRERVGAEHRGEHVRALRPVGRRVPAVVAELEPAADRVGAARLLRVGARRAIAVARRRRRSRAQQRPERRAREEQEGDHRRDRVAGQAEDEAPPSAPCDAEVGRLAGPQRDAPEDLLDAELRERRPDVVVLADRDAAADDGDVGRRAPARARRASPRGSSRDALDADATSAPAALGQRGDRVGVRVADRARAQRLVRRRAARRRWSARRPAAAARRRPRASPTEASTPSSAGAELGARREHASRRPRCPRRRGGCSRPAATVGATSTARRRRSVSSTRTTASAPVGHHRAGRDRDRLAGARARASAGCAGARLAGERAASPASRPLRPAVSAARTAKPSIAELSKPGTSSALATGSAEHPAERVGERDRLGARAALGRARAPAARLARSRSARGHRDRGEPTPVAMHCA